ncbi:uncharacterized protein PG998_004383 [Apiospora kogelbergensis]|uniref:uncharacterized protein n=1 Tax=Apiospora kogelbergensis TaxID=1337665 RepID=UPI00312D009F
MERPTPHSPMMEPSGSENDQNTAIPRGYSSSSNPPKSDTKPPSHTQAPSVVTCSVTGADHTSLLDFGIHVYLCAVHSGPDTLIPGGSSVGWEILNQLKHLTKDFSLVVGKWREESMVISDKAPDSSNHNDGNQPQSTAAENTVIKTDSDATVIEPTNVKDQSDVIQDGDDNKEQLSVMNHEVYFLDYGGRFLAREPWPEPFDLEKARSGVEASGQSTTSVYTHLTTDIPMDLKRSDEERQRITKEGYFRNPRVDFISLTQSMFIRSKQVIAVLRELVTYYPAVDLDSDVVVVYFPYFIIGHHMADLEAYKEALSDKRQQLGSPPPKVLQFSDVQRKITIDHLGQLLDYMNTSMLSRQVEAERARHAQNPPVCTFATLWLLYKPGTTIYVRNDKGTTSAYILENVIAYEGNSKNLEPPESYTLKMWCLSFDGLYVRRAKSYVTIGSFEGERPIMDLKVVPASFIDTADRGKTRQHLIQRGKTWYEMLTGAQQWHYSGQSRGRSTVTHDCTFTTDNG